jgi:peptidoglycan/xylan/chitin deacetylase (PgdA/CDA1 family)
VPAVLAPADVGRLVADGHLIGFHTRDHHALPTLTDEELAAALRDGREGVAQAAGAAVDTIAYPHGKADARVAAAARAAGFAVGYTTRGEPLTPGSDPLLIGRVDVGVHSPHSLAVALAWVLRLAAR